MTPPRIVRADASRGEVAWHASRCDRPYDLDGMDYAEQTDETPGSDTPAPGRHVRGPSRLEIELTAPPMTFAQFVWADYRAGLAGRDEDPLRSALLYPLRLLLNPSNMFAFLVRLAQKGPRPLLYPIRLAQVMLFSSEIHGFRGDDAIELGPGVMFPHPMGIIIGRATKIGAGVTIYNNTNIGANRHLPHDSSVDDAARLGDRCVIYAYTAVQGPYDVGHDAVVGIHVLLDDHVPPGGLRTQRKLRVAGEWPGEVRYHWRLPEGSEDSPIARAGELARSAWQGFARRRARSGVGR